MARLSHLSDPQHSSTTSSMSSRRTRSTMRTVSNETASTAPTSHAGYSNTSPNTSKTNLAMKSRSSARVRKSILCYGDGGESEPESYEPRHSSDALSASALQSRNVSGVSGDTLVNTTDPSRECLLDQGTRSLDLDPVTDNVSRDNSRTAPGVDLKRRRSTRLQDVLKEPAILSMSRSTMSSDGRRDKVKGLQNSHRRDSLRPRQPIYDEIIVAQQEPLRKKARTSSQTLSDPSPPAEARVNKAQPKVKRWQLVGLYVGQQRDFQANMSETQNKLRRQGKGADNSKPENNVLPLPMFAGQRLLENKLHRDFELPFDVYSPLPQRQPKPDEWRKTQSNRFVGDAASVWKTVKGLAPSKCVCTREYGCNEDCHNRTMFYECNDSNCAIGSAFCSNRAFLELESRKDGQDRGKDFRKYNIGVEVMQTADRGFGVRANRTFLPNQIIVEYAGEIITQDECDRRMNEEYKNNECYYLMRFTQNMIIDATRGSIARFVNHSCEPNCTMEMWIVNGKPRMALFAGKRGIMTGEELTYDYNFDPFSRKNVQECRCGTPSCRGFLGPKTKEDRLKPSKSTKEDRVKPSKLPKAELTKPSKSQEPSTGILAGAKRKFKEFLTGSNTSTSEDTHRDKAVLKKRKLASVGRSALAQVTRQVSGAPPAKKLEATDNSERDPKTRILRKQSRASLLPRIDNGEASLTKKSSSSRTSLTLPHRSSRASTAISRITSAVKRNASLLKPRPSTRTISTATTLGLGRRSFSSSRDTTTTRVNTRSTSQFIPKEPRQQPPASPNLSFLDKPYAPKHALDHTDSANGVGTTPISRSNSVHSTVAESIRKGVVRSVKGPRRAVAMARMGVGARGVEEAGRSIRFILGDEL